jgi:3-oxoacyl-[acyl-carrier-protein] synthase III
VYCSDLALQATQNALADDGLEPEDLEFIIFATLSPDHYFPGTGCYLQAKLGIPGIGCLDIRNQCTGFLYGLAVGDAMIRAGMYRHVLLVGAEIHSSALNFTDEGRDVSVLFGDAAAAVVLSSSTDENRGILYSELHADGRFAKVLCMDVWDISRKPYMTRQSVEAGEIWPHMDGKTVFKHAVTRMGELITNAMGQCSIQPDEIKYFIAHQANLRINQLVAERLGLPQAKFLNNIQKYGNTTAASIPLLLDQSYRAGKFQRGDLLLLVAFGSGFTWASTLMRW